MCLLTLYKITIFVRNNCIHVMCVILQTTTENKMTRICSFILIVLMGMSASIKGKCLNDKHTTTANEFLISKWKIWYKSLDANHDGKLSMEDAEESENKFSAMEHLDAKERKVTTERFNKFWDECIFEGKKREIEEHEYVDRLNNKFNANTEEFVKEIDRCITLIGYAVDVNEDKFISKDELLISHASLGHQHIVKDNDYFSAYISKHGLVPFRDMIDYWVEFLTGTDESKGEFIKRAFEVDGFE